MAKPAAPIDEDKVPGLERAFGDVLRKRRLAAKLTQEELAFEVDLDRTFLSLMERGQRRPSLTTIFILARHFGIAPSTLVREVEDRLKKGVR
jgi:transcriptional regulator with XRE-family HTH domain